MGNELDDLLDGIINACEEVKDPLSQVQKMVIGAGIFGEQSAINKNYINTTQPPTSVTHADSTGLLDDGEKELVIIDFYRFLDSHPQWSKGEKMVATYCVHRAINVTDGIKHNRGIDG